MILPSSITSPIPGSLGWAHYGTIKAVQLGFMYAAASELAKHCMTVHAILPSNIFTEGFLDVDAKYQAATADYILPTRLGTSKDVASVAPHR